MKGTKNFIIQLDEIYSETFKTKGGLKIYGNVDFTAERQSNRIATVVGVPELYNTKIKKGYEVLIDASPLYRQIYRGNKQWYQAMIDEDKNQFYLDTSMVICYRKNKDEEWIGFGENCLVKPILESQEKIKTPLKLPDNVSKPNFKGKVSMCYSNAELNELGVFNGDKLYMDIRGGVKYWFEGKEYWWVRTKDIHAKIGLN